MTNDLRNCWACKTPMEHGHCPKCEADVRNGERRDPRDAKIIQLQAQLEDVEAAYDRLRMFYHQLEEDNRNLRKILGGQGP